MDKRVCITRTPTFLNIGFENSRIAIYYNGEMAGQCKTFFGNTRKNNRIERDFHNKLISFFSNRDVIEAFAIDVKYVAQNLPYYSGGYISGRFKGFDGTYLVKGVEKDAVFVLKTRKVQSLTSARQRRVVYLEPLNGTVVHLENLGVTTVVSKDRAIYMKMALDISNNKVYFKFKGNNLEVSKIMIDNGKYAITVNGFAELRLTPEQLVSIAPDFFAIETVRTTYDKV